MPSTTPCPSCQALLLLQDRDFGQSVRCPKCREVFSVPMLALPVAVELPLPVLEPAPPAPPSPIPLLEPILESSADPARRDFDWWSLQGRGGRGRKGRWGTAHTGLMLVEGSLGISLLAIVLTFVMGMLHVSFETIGMMLLLAGISAAVLYITGQALCHAVPAHVGGGVMAIASAVFSGIADLLAVLVVTAALNQSGSLFQSLQVLALMMWLVLLIGMILWLLFLQGIANELRDATITTRIVLYGVVFGMWWLYGLVAGLDTKTVVQSEVKAQLFVMILFGGGLAMLSLHLIVLSSVTSLIARDAGRS